MGGVEGGEATDGTAVRGALWFDDRGLSDGKTTPYGGF